MKRDLQKKCSFPTEILQCREPAHRCHSVVVTTLKERTREKKCTCIKRDIPKKLDNGQSVHIDIIDTVRSQHIVAILYDCGNTERLCP